VFKDKEYRALGQKWNRFASDLRRLGEPNYLNSKTIKNVSGLFVKTEGIRQKEEREKVTPLFGKDEMNLIEFPFGPVRRTSEKTLEVEHLVFDKGLKREVRRRLVITGSDAFGLPRPIDDQVLIGMQTLTHEAGSASRRVEFSRYHLCRVIGWEPDGRSYARLEESFDRIAGTTLKFKDAWWDKGEREWKSKTFHLIEEADLCSRDRLDRIRASTGRTEQKLCSFVWNEVIWKSFQDGFIRTLDMTLFRKIAEGRRREVPLRLFRILDKRFWHGPKADFDLSRLCKGTLGLCSKYSPAQMRRVLDRAATWLLECEYLEEWWYSGAGSNIEVHFRKRKERHAAKPRLLECVTKATDANKPATDTLKAWMGSQDEGVLRAYEDEALAAGFGREFERKLVMDEKSQGISLSQAGRTRQEFLRRFAERKQAEAHQPPADSK
jgi:hypothetical protein